MKYKVKVIGYSPEAERLFYISDSLQDWLTTCRTDAANYYNIESARSAINQGIECIKQELDMYYQCELKEIRIIEEVTSELTVQTFNPSDI